MNKREARQAVYRIVVESLRRMTAGRLTTQGLARDGKTAKKIEGEMRAFADELSRRITDGRHVDAAAVGQTVDVPEA